MIPWPVHSRDLVAPKARQAIQMSHCSVDEKIESATPAMLDAMRVELRSQRRLAVRRGVQIGGAWLAGVAALLAFQVRDPWTSGAILLAIATIMAARLLLDPAIRAARLAGDVRRGQVVRTRGWLEAAVTRSRYGDVSRIELANGREIGVPGALHDAVAPHGTARGIAGPLDRLISGGALSKERFHIALATTLYTARAGEILEIAGEDGEEIYRHRAYVGMANDPDLSLAP